FALEGISGGNAVFNPEKLDWFNQQYIARRSAGEIIELIRPSLVEDGPWRDDFDAARTNRVIELLKPRSKRLTDFAPPFRLFVADRVERDPAAVAKHLGDTAAREHLAALREQLAGTEPFDAATLEPVVRALAEARGIKAGTIIHAARVAVTGQTVSPGIFDVLELVGRDRVLARI